MFQNKIYILIISLVSLFVHASSNIPHDPATSDTQRLEKQLQELIQQLSSQQKTLDTLTKIMLQNMLEKKKAKQLQIEQQQEAEAQQKELQQMIENLPSWQKYSFIIAGNAINFTTQHLWPTIKAQLTYMLARKLMEKGLDVTDFCTGTLPEKAGIPIIAFRFGEWLTLDEQAKEHKKSQRILLQNPEYRQRIKELKELQKTNLIGATLVDISQEIFKQVELQEKLNDERNAKQDAQTEKDQIAALNLNETPEQRAQRETKEEQTKLLQQAKIKIKLEKDRKELERLQVEEEAAKVQRMLQTLRSETTPQSMAQDLD